MRKLAAPDYLRRRPPCRSAVLDALPAYPSRSTPASGGGFWLTAFAARTQLVEFVLRETAYGERMFKEIDPRYWIAPSLRSGATFLEPMQGATSRRWAWSSRGHRRCPMVS